MAGGLLREDHRHRDTERRPCEDEAEGGCRKPKRKKGCWSRPEAGREAWKRVSLKPPEGTKPALTTRQFHTSGLQNCERIDFCCSKLPSLWSFVIAAPNTDGTNPNLCQSTEQSATGVWGRKGPEKASQPRPHLTWAWNHAGKEEKGREDLILEGPRQDHLVCSASS